MLRALAALCVLLALLLRVANARAERATVEFDTEPGDAPTSVCFVVRRGDGSSSFEPITSIQRLGSARSTDAHFWNIEAPPTSGLPKPIEVLQTLPKVAPKQTEASECKAAAPQAGATESASQPPSCGLGIDLNIDAASEGGGGEALKVICRGRPGRQERVVFAFIDFHLYKGEANTPRVTDAYFDGNLATVDYAVDGKKSPDFFSVRILGGSYLHDPERKALSESGARGLRARVSLLSRCRPRPLRFPAGWGSGRAKIVTKLGDRQTDCTVVTVAPGTAATILAYHGSEGVKKEVVAEWLFDAAEKEKGKNSPWQGERAAAARWTTTGSPATIDLQRTRLGFVWHIPKLYPKGTADKPVVARCPLADLAQAGVPCTAVALTKEECRYVCKTADDATDIPLPTTVRFRKHGTDEGSWNDSVANENQGLDGYQPAEQRALVVFTEWAEKRKYRDADEIDEIEIEISGGPSFRVLPAATHRLPFSGLREDAVVAYHIKGDRSFEWKTLSISTEALSVPEPDATVRKWTADLQAVGGLGSLPIYTGPDNEEPASWLFGMLRAGAIHRAADSRWGFGAYFGYMFSEREYFVLGKPTDAQRTAERVAYSRYVLDGGVTWYRSSRTALAAGAGVVAGRAFNSTDTSRVGDFTVSPTVYATARLRIYDPFWVSWDPRVLLFEPIYSHSLTSTSAPVVAEHSVTSFLLLSFAVRAEFGFL